MRKAYLRFVKANYQPIESGNDAYATHTKRLEYLSKELQQNIESLNLADGRADYNRETLKNYRGLLDYWVGFLKQYQESLPAK